MRRSVLISGALAALLAVGLTACGDDDSTPEEAATADGDETTETTEAALATEACAGISELNQAVAEIPEGPEAAAYMTDVLLPVVDGLTAIDATEVSEPATVLQEGLADPAALANEPPPEVLQALSDLGGAAHAGCGLPTMDVTAVDYGFEGVPEALAAGEVSIAMANEGNEDHEMVVFRKADDETGSAEDILALPDAQFEEAAEFTAVTFGSPGQTGYTQADLTAGEYFAVCFIPVGGATDGPPHFTRGMVAEFAVE